MSEAKLRDGFKSSMFLPVEIDGVTMTLGDWAKQCGLGYSVVKTRYKRGKRGKELIAPARIYLQCSK